MLLPLTVIVVIANFIIGLFVLLNNTNSSNNRLFFFLCFSVIFWSIANYFSVFPPAGVDHLLLIRLVLFFATPLAAFFFLFIYTFPSGIEKSKVPFLILYSCIIVVTMGLTLTRYVFSSLVQTSQGATPVSGSLVTIFALVAFGSIFLGLCLLLVKFTRSSGLVRVQLLYILAGTAVMFILIFSTIFLPVVLWSNAAYVPYASFYTIAFVGSVAYAIIKHQFLDIRLIVARSVGYTLLGIVFASLYTVILFLVSTYIFKDNLTNYQTFVYATIALIVAFSFQPLKLALEDVTDLVFFKGGYRTHELIGRLTKIMAMNQDLKNLSTQILQELLGTMRIEKGAFYIFSDTKLFPVIQQGFATDIILSEIAVARLTIERRIVIYEDEKVERIKDLLRPQGIKVVLPLYLKGKELGILVLGNKKSGDSYSPHDINVLEIVSPEMSVAIENAKSYEEIRQFNLTLTEKVQKATEELRNANTRLKELDKLKDEFVSLASHELRTPMTAIKSYLWMVIYGKDSQLTPKQRQYLDVAYFSTERLINLVNDMLNVSRLESGRIMLDRQPSVLDALVQSVVDEISPRSQELGIRVTIADHDLLPQVFIDETKIREVLLNLIGNSLKFTPKGGSITISFSVLEGFVEVQVTDTGRGILPEDKPKLFQKFGLIAGSYTQKTISQGTGLGLYITKSIIEMHGGKIGADSPGRDKGATVFFTLPVYNQLITIAKNERLAKGAIERLPVSPGTSLPLQPSPQA